MKQTIELEANPEPYRQVDQLFQADLHARLPDWAHRSSWVVISGSEIRHVDAVDVEGRIGDIAIEHLIINTDQDYLRLTPEQKEEFDRYEQATSEDIKLSESKFLDHEMELGRLFSAL